MQIVGQDDHHGRGGHADHEREFTFPLPKTDGPETLTVNGATGVGTRDHDRYRYEVKIPLDLMAGDSLDTDTLGLLITFGDMDRPEFLNPQAAYARDNLLVWPPAPEFDYWRDPRAAGLVILKE